MISRTWLSSARIGFVLFSVLSVPARLLPQQAPTYSLLYTFSGGADGAGPNGLVRDEANNFYGTTVNGGVSSCSAVIAPGCGVVFKLDVNGKQTTLYNFHGSADGGQPAAAVVLGQGGSLYGTSLIGGAYGQGTVFELRPTGDETSIYDFTGEADGGSGGFGVSGLVRDRAGNFYGTTYAGGAFGVGVVFKLDPAGRQTVIHTFTDEADGGQPLASLVLDPEGNLYGTTSGGGAFGQGVVFKLDPRGLHTVLYNFTGGKDGGQPVAPLLRDSDGTIYGVASSGGNTSGLCSDIGGGCGTVFRLGRCGKDHARDTGCKGPMGNFSVLYTFTGQDGAVPYGGLVKDGAGNLYGTTLFGGDLGGVCAGYCGVVFELDAEGQERVLHSFTGGADGSNPYTETLVLDEMPDNDHEAANAESERRCGDPWCRRSGAVHVYGTTQFGGSGFGVAFRMTIRDRR